MKAAVLGMFHMLFVGRGNAYKLRGTLSQRRAAKSVAHVRKSAKVANALGIVALKQG